MSEHELRFSLDIGTRSIIGLVTRPTETGIEILGCERFEHSSRAMLDGQIHNIPEVAEVIIDIKRRLEKNFGPLNSAAVAAAGRALCTIKTRLEQNLTSFAPLQKEDIRRLEIATVQAAQQQLAEQQSENDHTAYYCVGYSVVTYVLDDNIISSLEGQRGKVVGIELIATFLPHMVIESLQSALALADLDIQSLTLEPIAAINVLIPSTMRHLNLALVDVGAGTSDIAITSNGTVVAYGMVPFAGDEITESISHHYVLDFNLAEQIKCSLHQPTVEFTDVLGFSYTKDSSQIIADIEPEVISLAETITEQIMALNGKAPQAVLLIGGGSLTPGLAPILAEKLKLPPERVGIREAKSVQGFINLPEFLHGPDGITPLGITKTAHSQTLNFLQVTVNDALLRLFNFGTITVSDAMLTAELNIRHLQGRPGMGLSVTVNGKPQFFSGTMGQPPMILLNDIPATLDTPLANRDILVITRGQDGLNASGTIADVLPKIKSVSIKLNGKTLSIPPIVLAGGHTVKLNESLVDGLKIDIIEPQRLHEVFRALNITLERADLPNYVYTINGAATTYVPQYSFTVNELPATLETQIYDGDTILLTPPSGTPPLLGDLLSLDCASDKYMELIVNGSPITLCLEKLSILMNGVSATPTTPLLNKAVITFKHVYQAAPIVSEILLRFEDKILEHTKLGDKLIVTLNGETANYVAPLKNGDRLDLIWEPASSQKQAN
mgnify:CR=1 FL=1